MAGSYNEVHIDSDFNVVRSLTLDVLSTGVVEANIQDNVFQDKAGGFTYQHNRKFSRTTRNRSIFWKVSQNCIHLTEVSQDLHLYGNKLRLILDHVKVLPNVSIHETADSVCIIIATTLSVFRLSWPHPVKDKEGTYTSTKIDASSGSIFCNDPSGTEYDACCLASLQKKFHTFSAFQSNSGECFVSLVASDGSLVLVNLPPSNEQASPRIHELKQTSIMKRLWTGFIPTVLRGDDLPHDSVQFCEIHKVGEHTFIFTLCKDLKMRIWSCTSLECVEEFDLMPLLPDVLDVQSGIAQAHMIRKAVDSETDTHYLAIFLNFQFQSQFFAFEIYEDESDVELSLLSSHFSKLTSLLDFCLTSRHIWALWASATGDSVLQYACIEENDGSDTSWQDVTLRSNETSRLFVHHSSEPKDIFISNLFMPGRFSKNVLLKTIKMMTASFDDDIIDLKISANSTMNDIRTAVENLVEYEFNNFTADQDIEEDDYYNLQMQCWNRFYASALQYDQVERKPIGLFAEDVSGLVTIIRQNYRGYLVSNSWLEQLYQQDVISEESDAKRLHDQAGIVDQDVASDILAWIECIKLLSKQFTENTFTNIENCIANNDDVKEICAALARDLFTDASNSLDLLGDANSTANFVRHVQLKLKDRQNLFDALTILIDAMDPVKWLPVDFENFDKELSVFSVNSSHSFSSKEGRAIITEWIHSRALLNMEICRDCLLLTNVLICMGASAGIHDDKRSMLQARFIPRLHELLRSFFTVVWLRRSAFNNDDADMIESSLKKFAALELVENGRTVKKSKWDDSSNQSVLSCFINHVGLSNCLNIFASLPAESQNDENGSKPWNYDFKLISDMIFRSVWPCRDGTCLAEFLFSQGQASLLSEYLFICNDWCRYNPGSREFLLGQAYLQNGDHDKARQHFFKATKFIGNGENLLSRLVPEDERDKMIISYFIMVTRLFEQFENPEMKILVATTAIFLAKNSKSKDVAMLWSNIFNSHLQLGHIQEAYQAIVLNPEKERRRNCLHNFIVSLCERKQFQELCGFSYSSMEDDVVSIIESRARTIDITVNDYYDILFSFHSFRGNMRRAATAMYEYACRLQKEMHGLASLQQQAKCYLAAINCLHICEEKFAWIVCPSEKQRAIHEEEEILAQGRSPKRKEDGEELVTNIVDRRKSTKRTVIVELPDLEKEYLLIVARLNLLQFDRSTSTIIGPNLSATELIPLLCQAGLFDRAFSVAIAFKVGLTGIFESVAVKCVRVSSDVSLGVVNDDAFNWLASNDLGTIQSINDISASEQAWRLLESYLTKFTEMNGSIYHKPIATKLLSLGCNLPTWFVNDYKRRNPAELLRIYINFDMLEKAGELAIEYINAVIGIGKESFGIQQALHALSSPVWLPYSALDQLMSLLKDNNSKPCLQQVEKELIKKLTKYFELIRTTSNDKLSLAMKTSQSMVIS